MFPLLRTVVDFIPNQIIGLGLGIYLKLDPSISFGLSEF